MLYFRLLLVGLIKWAKDEERADLSYVVSPNVFCSITELHNDRPFIKNSLQPVRQNYRVTIQTKI